MNDAALIAFAAIAGYLAGSVPFGLVLTRAAGIDIRAVGSGNIGATNVLRTGRKGLALATLVLDSFKAGLAALAAREFLAGGPLGTDIAFVAGGAAFLGHCFPVWLGFRGGKGVATYAGLSLFAAWQVFLLIAAVWLAVFAASRISSLAALSGALLAPIAAWFLGQGLIAVAAFGALSVLVLLTHRENIKRLARGAEPRFGRKTTEAP